MLFNHNTEINVVIPSHKYDEKNIITDYTHRDIVVSNQNNFNDPPERITSLKSIENIQIPGIITVSDILYKTKIVHILDFTDLKNNNYLTNYEFYFDKCRQYYTNMEVIKFIKYLFTKRCFSQEVCVMKYNQQVENFMIKNIRSVYRLENLLVNYIDKFELSIRQEDSSFDVLIFLSDKIQTVHVVDFKRILYTLLCKVKKRTSFNCFTWFLWRVAGIKTINIPSITNCFVLKNVDLLITNTINMIKNETIIRNSYLFVHGPNIESYLNTFINYTNKIDLGIKKNLLVFQFSIKKYIKEYQNIEIFQKISSIDPLYQINEYTMSNLLFLAKRIAVINILNNISIDNFINFLCSNIAFIDYDLDRFYEYLAMEYILKSYLKEQKHLQNDNFFQSIKHNMFIYHYNIHNMIYLCQFTYLLVKNKAKRLPDHIIQLYDVEIISSIAKTVEKFDNFYFKLSKNTNFKYSKEEIEILNLFINKPIVKIKNLDI